MTSWPSISTATLGDRVYASIRDQILKGALAPGRFLREIEVSTALGVSRTPVREALARLAQEGFVEGQARRGYRVPAEPIEQLLELYPVVTALEVLAAELAFPRMTREVIAQLREINERCVAALHRGAIRKAIEANDEFHHVLSQSCRNNQLCKLLDTLRAQVVRLEYWSAQREDHAQEAIDQHVAILDAIERRDFATALSSLRANRLQTYTAYHRELAPPTSPPAKPAKRTRPTKTASRPKPASRSAKSRKDRPRSR